MRHLIAETWPKWRKRVPISSSTFTLVIEQGRKEDGTYRRFAATGTNLSEVEAEALRNLEMNADAKPPRAN